jgi:8-oxo-dGTP diphosphatase
MTEEVAGRHMVVGFLFREQSVLLVQKNRPSWQRGLLNGVGGALEIGESPLEAMVREFREETRYQGDLDWRYFCLEHEPFGAWVHFFVADTPEAYWWPSHNDVGELMYWMHVANIYRAKCVGNLGWLLPLAMDWRSLEPVTIRASGDIRERPTW